MRAQPLALLIATSLVLIPVAAYAQGTHGSTKGSTSTSPSFNSQPFEQTANPPRRYHLSLYYAKWAEVNLTSIPRRLLTLDIPLFESYFVSLGGAYVLLPDFTIPLGLFALSGCDLEMDAQLLRHFGLQSHIESTLALVFRTGDINFWDVLSLNFAMGEGFSLASSRPAYEKGPSGRRGFDSRRLQNHLLFELEFTRPSIPFAHVVIRLHHRSGIYGVISPQRTGSNFLGIGFRLDG